MTNKTHSKGTKSIATGRGATPRRVKPPRSGKPTRMSAWKFSRILGGAPLLPGECWDDYDLVQTSVFKALQPEDALQTMITKDIGDAIFHAERLKRLLANYIEKRFMLQVRNEFAEILPRDPTSSQTKQEQAQAFVRETLSQTLGRDKLLDKLRQAGINPRWLLADVTWEKLDGIERLEKLIEAAERKRDRLLRQYTELTDRTSARRRPPVIELEPEDVSSR